jgi:hypothetical protein
LPPHRLAAVAVDQADDLFVNLPHEDHLDDVHGLFVGHPHPLDEFRLLPQLFQKASDLRTAAVDDDGIDSYILHHDHIAGEIVLQFLIHHRMAAILDHDGLVEKAADIWKSLDQDFGPLHRFLHIVHRLLLVHDLTPGLPPTVIVVLAEPRRMKGPYGLPPSVHPPSAYRIYRLRSSSSTISSNWSAT